MSFVITVAQRKGGAGKTTLACHLASAFRAAGLSVRAIDADPQKSFSLWGAARRRALPDENAFSLEQASGFALSGALRASSSDIVIIDTPPSVDMSVERAIRASDLVLTPLQLSPIDLAASLPTAQAIGEAGRPFLFVINRAPPRARIADDIRAQIKKHRIPCASTELGNRAAYAEAIAQGLGVVESEPASLAGQEVSALAREVLKRRSAREKAA
ncbi:MAG: ParA family protein [Parvularculaceae bacterium]|nr:ParA family protein [Parvularculaceae bacterium]